MSLGEDVRAIHMEGVLDVTPETITQAQDPNCKDPMCMALNEERYHLMDRALSLTAKAYGFEARSGAGINH